MPSNRAGILVLMPYSGSSCTGTQYTPSCTIGSPHGSRPGGNSAAMHSGSVGYLIEILGQPEISAGRLVGCSAG